MVLFFDILNYELYYVYKITMINRNVYIMYTLEKIDNFIRNQFIRLIENDDKFVMELLWCLILKNYTQNSTTKIQDNIIYDLRIALPLDKILQQYNQNSSVKEYIRILNGNQDINKTESISVSVTIENIPEHIIYKHGYLVMQLSLCLNRLTYPYKIKQHLIDKINNQDLAPLDRYYEISIVETATQEINPTFYQEDVYTQFRQNLSLLVVFQKYQQSNETASFIKSMKHFRINSSLAQQKRASSEHMVITSLISINY